MDIVRWSPFREFDNLFRGYERPTLPVRRADWLPLVDIRETGEDYQIDVEVPAVASEDLTVSVADGVLSVSGERKSPEIEQSEESEGRVHHTERHYGSFERSFKLPEDADEEAVTAASRDGVLYLKIAKRQVAVAKTIDVKVV